MQDISYSCLTENLYVYFSNNIHFKIIFKFLLDIEYLSIIKLNLIFFQFSI